MAGVAQALHCGGEVIMACGRTSGRSCEDAAKAFIDVPHVRERQQSPRLRPVTCAASGGSLTCEGDDRYQPGTTIMSARRHDGASRDVGTVKK